MPVAPAHSINLPNIVKQLVVQGKLQQVTAENSVRQSLASKIPIIPLLIKNKTVSADDIAAAIAKAHNLRVIDLAAVEIQEEVKELLSEEQISNLQLLPLVKKNNQLVVGVAELESLAKLDDLKFSTGLNPQPVVISYDKFQTHLSNLKKHSETLDTSDVGLTVSDETREQSYALDSVDLERFENDDNAVSRFVNRMLEHAIEHGVSDIHIEPYEEVFRIRYRMDGILTVVSTPPKKTAQQLVSRLKVMSRMNISERRVPQDGNIRFSYDDDTQKMDFRVNTLPTMHGEKVVMRILDSSAAEMGIDQLGFNPVQKKNYMDALAKPDGMILVTGPTGSGKTVTLYTGLNILNRPEKNISTAEDPVEIQLAGVNQVNVNNKVGLTFSSALKAFLRQDPDIIMVGEIRDMETGEIAIKAAQTGHLVLSTLHTNSAPETLTRLINMGIPAFNIASSVNLIIAQRLARRLCSCKQHAKISRDVLLYQGFKEEELASLKIYKAVGCDKCSHGYKGRVGIYQVMPMSDVMGRMVMDGGTAIDLADQAAKEGILDLREAGLNKIREGLTTIEEIDRVTKD